ncbi:ABC transporter ATP-binding protein [Azospirillum sp. SYSU D00513]|uniref:ABC transporter ATP-binding protein n=1 Tax=Azospirillum sp. SYSU D00513 TaxID=2812561 RepID=UPI001A96C7EB|nr:ABC transporter ATP-binding protein [Azospirillum sp. SYSU D00513]
MSETMLELSNIVRSFEQAGTRLDVLRGAALTVRAGELVALVGPSGAGKSTLLHIAGLLERPTSGTVRIGGTDVSTLDDAKRTEVRRRSVGFVYQFHHLLPEFSALENIVLPQMIAGVARREAAKRAAELLRMVGLEARGDHRPARLSGGEQQRVAIARALANAPGLLIADEPTGNLDPNTAEGVFSMLTNLVRQSRVGALVATHNLDLARRMDRVLEMRDGLLVEH